MIVRISGSGKSFKGLGTYLLHDPKAATSARVAWTHTLNLANDDAELAIGEMVQTARNAELLKQESGIRAGGRCTRNTVKHVSLNWAPGEAPAREQMIEATETFLRHMRWHDRQTVIIAHSDKHPHVHLMINAVHPQTGLKIDENFERRRAQKWALDYERAQNRIYCEQRLKRPGEREDAMPRDAWQAFHENQKQFENAEKSLFENHSDNSENTKNAENKYADEWTILKKIQRRQREAFFAAGKSAFSNLRKSIYREVREQFRERWADYYKARENGGHAEMLATFKANIIGDQKIILEGRRDAACKILRENRDSLYRDLLDQQREIRAELRARQEAGLDNTDFLRGLEGSRTEQSVRAEYRGKAEAAASRRDAPERNRESLEAAAESGEGSKPQPAPRRASVSGRFAAAAEQTGRNQHSISESWTKNKANGGSENDAPENDHRALPAALAPIPSLAIAKDEESKPSMPHVLRANASLRATAETRRNDPHLMEDDEEVDRDAESAIDTEFQRRLAGLHYVPPHLRAQARRAATEWRRLALKALREKRAAKRHARRMLLRSQLPPRSSAFNP